MLFQHIPSRTVDDVTRTSELIAEFVDSQNMISAELKLRKQKWLSVLPMAVS